MFGGRFDHTIDDKGRVSIPAQVREALARDNQETVFVTNWVAEHQRCLAVFPPANWTKLVGKASQRASLESSMQAFQMFFIGGAHEVQVDRQGRILIPPRLREYAHLGRDVTFSAMLDHFQLWDKSVLTEVLGKVERQFLEDSELIGKLNL
ncbi:MAG TPA: division/cell wall cluster transcriptional repressor MraZ [Candidatus Binataceae bacterium]|nr:division/cell wall cluster transcriptional repressor MraZ [Candidatus Binataceae bacterium]